MSVNLYRSRALAVGVLCAAGGIGAGAVATAAASSGHSSTTRTAQHARHHGEHGKAGRKHGEFRHALREVAHHSAQGSLEVHTKQGYKTISFERGRVTAVNGDSLTLAEGSSKAPYKTVTLTIPATAHVRADDKKATMSDVTVGERAIVMQLPKREVVIARAAKSAPQG